MPNPFDFLRTPPFVGGSKTPGIVEGDDPPGGNQGPTPRWLQAFQQYAPYAMLGAMGARGGIGGTIGAMAASTLMNQIQQAKKRKVLKGAMTTMPTKEDVDALSKQAGMIPTTDDGGLGDATQDDTTGYRKGGRLKFVGTPSRKLAGSKKAGGGAIDAVHAVNATRQLERVPRMGVSAPHAAPFRAKTGRFAQGGLVRGMGAAIRGTKFKGEC